MEGRCRGITKVLGISMDGLRKTMKTRDRWSAGRDLKTEPPEYEVGVLTTRSQRSVRFHRCE
jgi:hypothetical protein